MPFQKSAPSEYLEVSWESGKPISKGEFCHQWAAGSDWPVDRSLSSPVEGVTVSPGCRDGQHPIQALQTPNSLPTSIPTFRSKPGEQVTHGTNQPGSTSRDGWQWGPSSARAWSGGPPQSPLAECRAGCACRFPSELPVRLHHR